eukprot:c28895_g1_i1 orf=657-1592(+)
MAGCFGFSFMQLKFKRTRAYFRSHGLESKSIEIDNNSILNCWAPRPVQDEKRIQSTCRPKPALLLLHGFGADGMTSWEYQIAPLTKQFSLYIPDLVFFGDSTTRSTQRSEYFQAECMSKMMLKLGVQKAVVAGFSYGGFVAFRMAHLYPEFVERLVIISSGICMNPRTNDILLENSGASDITQVLLPESIEGLRKSFDLIFSKVPWLPDCLYRDMLETMGGNREGKVALINGLVLGKQDAPPLPKIDKDILILWGEHDKIFSVKLAHQFKEQVGKQAELIIIKDAGHMVAMEKPNHVNTALLSFLNSTYSQ